MRTSELNGPLVHIHQKEKIAVEIQEIASIRKFHGNLVLKSQDYEVAKRNCIFFLKILKSYFF